MNDEMTVMDYFAAKAMVGLLGRETFFAYSDEAIAKAAYGIARAMIRERQKQRARDIEQTCR